jgi:hypothetical protein
MSEDVSATMRVGITVILVAALVATVLNLMVMSNSLLSNGQTTLQSGIDSVSTQEFATYDNTKVSGTQVATALSLFQGRDVGIIIQTSAVAKIDSSVYVNYGALFTKNGMSSSSSNSLEVTEGTTNGTNCSDTLRNNLISSTAKTAYLVKLSEETPDAVDSDSCVYSVYRKNGAANYTGYLHNTNGLVDSSYDIIGTTSLGNAAYLLSSSRFSSVLIKDPTGSIVGIAFKQIS